VIKRWDCQRGSELLKTWVCRSRSERAGLYALALERAGLATAPVVAWGERRRYGLAGWSYLLMEYVADGIDLGQRRGDRTAVIVRIGDLIGRLHEQGFTHRDLKPSNLLIARDNRPYLIDLDGLRRVGRVSPARALADVVKLGRRMVELSTLSPREAAHFVRHYCLARGISPRRQWWQTLKSEAGRYPEFQSIVEPAAYMTGLR
jgi:tRNA A-37 threonylcarbamoyl transferase component Bud32